MLHELIFREVRIPQKEQLKSEAEVGLAPRLSDTLKLLLHTLLSDD